MPNSRSGKLALSVGRQIVNGFPRVPHERVVPRPSLLTVWGNPDGTLGLTFGSAHPIHLRPQKVHRHELPFGLIVFVQ